LFGGLAAGFINVIAGGGSLITLPLLIFVGVPATSANGTIRLAILVSGLTATLRFHRAGAIDWKHIPVIALPACAGATVGAIVASHMANSDFRSLIGWITLAAGALLVLDFGKMLAGRETDPSRLRRVLFLASMLAVGFYGGLAQAGVGYLLLASLVLGGGFALVQANVLKVVLVTCFTPITLLVFGLSDQIHLGYAAVLTVGQAAGAYIGASLSLQRGAALIRPVLALAVVAAAIKLIVT
jgi:uncharacterized protein